MEIQASNGKHYRIQKYGNPYGPSSLWLGPMLYPDILSTNEKEGLWDAHIGEGTALPLKDDNIINIDYVNPLEGQDNDLTMADLAEIIRSIVDQLPVARLDAMIGVGFGGQVALETMVTYPELARKLALVACGARTSSWVLAWQYLWRMLLEGGEESTAWQLVLLCDEHWSALRPGVPAWAGDIDPALGGSYRRVVDLQRRATMVGRSVGVDNFLALLHASQAYDVEDRIDRMPDGMPLLLITETDADPLLREEMVRTLNLFTTRGRYRLYTHEQNVFGHLQACRMETRDAEALAKFLTEVAP